MAVVGAEDTRLTRRLWTRHGIETPLVSFHAHSPPSRSGELVARLEAGEDVALVTDAGTPLVSDPGEGLVAAWAARGGRVVPVPGPSAVLAALVASGIPAPRWGFEGFLPRRGSERRERLAADRGRRARDRPVRVAGTDGCDAAGPGGGLWRRAGGRRVPRAHEAARGGRVAVRWPSWRRGPRIERSRARSRSWSREPRPTSRRRRRPATSPRPAPASMRLVRGGMARSQAAKQVAVRDRPAPPRAFPPRGLTTRLRLKSQWDSASRPRVGRAACRGASDRTLRPPSRRSDCGFAAQRGDSVERKWP